MKIIFQLLVLCTGQMYAYQQLVKHNNNLSAVDKMKARSFIESFGSKTFEQAHNEMHKILSPKQLSDIFTKIATKSSIFTAAVAIAYLNDDTRNATLSQIDPIFNNQEVRTKFLRQMSIVDALAWYAVIDKKMQNGKKSYREWFTKKYTNNNVVLTHDQCLGLLSHVRSLPFRYMEVKELYPDNFVDLYHHVENYHVEIDGIVIKMSRDQFNALRPWYPKDLNRYDDILRDYNDNLHIKAFSKHANVQDVRISKQQLFCLSRYEIDLLHNINMHHDVISLVDKTQQNIEWNKKYLICFAELIQKEHLIINHDADFVLFVSCRYRFLPKIFSRMIFSWISYILTRNYFIFSSFVSELVVGLLLDYLFKPEFCPPTADFYWVLRHSLFFLFNIMDCFCHDAWLYNKFIFLAIVSFYFIPYNETYEHATRKGRLFSANGFEYKTYGNKYPPDHQIPVCWKKIPDLLRSNIVEVY